MYKYIFILITAVLLTSLANADEYLMGRVISIDQQKGEIIVNPIEYIAADQKERSFKSEISPVTVRLFENQGNYQHVWERRLSHLTPGRHIRIRGELDIDSLLFWAKDVRGGGHRGRHDPTGVRERLGRACDRGRPPHPGGCGKRWCPEGKINPPPLPGQSPPGR